MALIKCPECGKEFSNRAAACPNCGCPNDFVNCTPNNQSTDNTSFENDTSKTKKLSMPDVKNYKKEKGAKLPLKSLVLWGLSIFMALTAILFVSDSVLTFIFALPAAIICNPLFLKKFHIKRVISISAFIVLFLLTANFVPTTVEQKQQSASIKETESKIHEIESESILFTETESTPISESSSDVTSEMQTIVSTDISETETETIVKSAEDTFVDSLTQNPFVTVEAAKEAYSILTQDLGFEDISVENDGNGTTLFKVNADGYTLKLTVSDKPYMIICGDYNLYQNATINYTKQDLENRNVGDNAANYYVMAKEAVSSTLTNPSSAVFSSLENCQIARNGEYVVVKGYVDAANSFNAQIRNDFLVELKIIDLSSYSYEVVYLNIGGESTGTYVDIK